MLFNQASFSVNLGEHIGVIGPNGAGKSTLFKALVGQIELDSGQIIKSQQLKVGYLEQESDWNTQQSSEEFLEEHSLKKLWELKQIGEGLGLTEEHFKSPLHKLSGGYRMRMKLVYLIGQEPNLMLLDEPTNFLDLESILALESFLQSFEGAFLLISHDREFLRRTTESTLEIEAGEITKFPGQIDDYFEQKKQLREVLEAQKANQESKRKQIQEFIDRFGAKATKAKQAQSRMKQLDKMEVIELKDLSVTAKIQIPKPISTGREVLFLDSASLGYSDNLILKNVTLRLNRGFHLGIVGVNGAGKSTLLKSLAQKIPLLSGSLQVGYQVSLGFFSQHSADQLDLDDRVIDALEKAANRDVMRQEILNLAGSLLFAGDDIYKPIRVLSGGEKSRVALGQILLKKSPVLLLDEPTNHLDFETVEALTEALRDYEGTLVVISHDRSFIRRVSKQILEIKAGSVDIYPGTYDEYVWSIQNQKKQKIVEPEKSQSSFALSHPVNEKKVNPKEELKRQNVRNRELQSEIIRKEKVLNTLEQERSTKTLELNLLQGQKAIETVKLLKSLSEQINQLEEEIIVIMENLELGLKKSEELKNS
ncbi:MAG: ATP-binding cassette domain-containing protein [Bdellovibrionaceae bacterium]|nr:ATP-binding cassette domain-containing protein [Pseudobdellovibrionaceae bacterium]